MREDEAFLEKPCGSKRLLEAVSLLRNHNQRELAAALTADTGPAMLSAVQVTTAADAG